MALPFSLADKLLTLHSQTKQKHVTLPHLYPSDFCGSSSISGHFYLGFGNRIVVSVIITKMLVVITNIILTEDCHNEHNLYSAQEARENDISSGSRILSGVVRENLLHEENFTWGSENGKVMYSSANDLGLSYVVRVPDCIP